MKWIGLGPSISWLFALAWARLFLRCGARPTNSWNEFELLLPSLINQLTPIQFSINSTLISFMKLKRIDELNWLGSISFVQWLISFVFFSLAEPLPLAAAITPQRRRKKSINSQTSFHNSAAKRVNNFISINLPILKSRLKWNGSLLNAQRPHLSQINKS